MSNVRVLIVDDSAAMRALFCDILDQAKGVEVVGTARSADEARDQIDELNPDVLTLDVEMPGMTGMEFLAEIMGSKPMPVIMLSSVTQQGTGTAQKAIELGAVDCFPKPLHSSPEEFNATVEKLGALIIAAASSDLSASGEAGGASTSGFEPDGRVVVLAGGSESIETVRQVIAAYPANCPPTVILVDADADVVERAVDRLRPSVACKIEEAGSNVMLVPGTVYLAFRDTAHVVVENDYAPVLNVIERDPVGGHRPSADMLFASVARAGLPALGGLLAEDNIDGVRGLDALAKTGAQAFAESGQEGELNQRFAELSKMGTKAAGVAASDVPGWILSATSKQDLAA
ncbi:response regulator [Alteraurantiacibacter aquimixticola]|nr:response regulator [Alteraurantiacibacter aquimixticola]